MTTRDLAAGTFWSSEHVVVTRKDGRLKFSGEAREARNFIVPDLGVTFEVKVLSVEGDETILPDVRVYTLPVATSSPTVL
jgi:hypothetical protein